MMQIDVEVVRKWLEKLNSMHQKKNVPAAQLNESESSLVDHLDDLEINSGI
jgi:ribosomal 50S subunit-associated protein YjgA (DUF615 family)